MLQIFKVSGCHKNDNLIKKTQLKFKDEKIVKLNINSDVFVYIIVLDKNRH